MNTAQQIRKIRKSRNLTQAYMAGKLRISKTSYGNIERNSIKRLTLTMIMAIAKELRVHYSVLLGEEGKYVRKDDPEGMPAIKAYLRRLLRKVESIEVQLQRMQQPL